MAAAAAAAPAAAAASARSVVLRPFAVTVRQGLNDMAREDVLEDALLRLQQVCRALLRRDLGPEAEWEDTMLTRGFLVALQNLQPNVIHTPDISVQTGVFQGEGGSQMTFSFSFKIGRIFEIDLTIDFQLVNIPPSHLVFTKKSFY